MSGKRCNERGKVVFPNFAIAKQMADRLTWKHKKRGDYQPKVEPYICPDCGMWHVGRGPQGKDQDGRVALSHT